MSDLREITIEKLVPHPQNPRLSMRADVVDTIRREIEARGQFLREHALVVRPLNGGFQIVAGHHRAEAAKRAGLATVPCWVREMGDEEAFLQLVLSNTQGELTPLEIGLHALDAVPREQGGRGRRGGLSEYAERLGKTKQYLAQLRDAAEVYRALKPSSPDDGFGDKAKHLAAIHQADRRAWAICVEALLKNGWSLAETEERVKKLREFKIPEDWEQTFLPYERVIAHFLGGAEFSPTTVSSLQSLAATTLTLIDAKEETPTADREKAKHDFLDWLEANTGGDSWKVRKVTTKQQELLTRLEQAADRVSSAWIHGDWRNHVGALREESVSLLLTDPPYGIEFKGKNRRNQRRSEAPELLQNDGREEALEELRALLEAILPKLRPNAHVLVFCHWRLEPEVREVVREAGLALTGSLIWAKNNHGAGDLERTFAPKHERIVHAVKGDPVLYEREPDVLEADKVPTDRHPTEKPIELLMRLIEATTVQGELVADPFAGVASTLVAAEECGRMCWGCEIDEGYYTAGKKRLLG